MSVRTITTTGMTAAGSANSAVTLTIAAVTGKRPIIRHISWSYSSAPTGKLLVSLVSATVFQLETFATGAGALMREIRGDMGDSASITLEAGGAGVSGLINADWIYVT